MKEFFECVDEGEVDFSLMWKVKVDLSVMLKVRWS